MISPAPRYHGYRFPPEIIAHAVWLYFRFSLSLRDVEDLLAQRGIPAPQGFLGHLIAREFSQEACRDEEAR